MELLFRGTFAPGKAKSLKTFVPWNFHTPGTFAPQEQMFQELSHPCMERSLHKQLLCPLTFTPVELLLLYLKKVVESRKAMFP